MNRRLRGFTIAEMLISLLIISLVLSAAIPTITKKRASSESIWQWSQSAGSAYFGEGSKQTAIIGDEYLNVMSPAILDSYTANMAEFNDVTGGNSAQNITNDGDKLALIKQSTKLADGKLSDVANSHISFYTRNSQADSTASEILYTGRLVLEKHNLGLGIGTLANMIATDSTYQGKNTALGHYALMRNTQGSYNTAVGENALAKSTFASNNTVVGFNAGLNLDSRIGENVPPDYADGNTVIGSSAMQYNTTGRYNTVVGFNALGISPASGTGNTVVGTNACTNSEGSFNVCLGLNTGNGLFSNDSSVAALTTQYKIVNGSGDYLFLLGSTAHGNTDYAPLLMGRTQSYGSGTNFTPKYLSVNTRTFDVNTYTGNDNIFRIDTIKRNINTDKDEGDNAADKTVKGTLSLNTYKDTATTNSPFVTFKVMSALDNEVSLNAVKTNGATKDYSVVKINDGVLEIKKSTYKSGDKTLMSTIVSAHDPNVATYPYVDLELNQKQLSLFANGDSKLQNSGNTSYVHLYQSGGGIDIFSSRMEVSTKTGKAFVFGDRATATERANGIFRVGGSSATVPSAFYGDVTMNNKFAVVGLKNVGTNIGFAVGTSDEIKAVLDKLCIDINTKITQSSSQSSDERLKNISGDNTAGLKEINALEVKNFTFKSDKEKKPHVGVIAQQLKKVFPNSVFKGEDGYYRIKTEEIFYAMVNSIKELFAQIQEITAKVVGLDERLQKLETENAQLKKQNADFEKRLERLEAKM